MFVLGNGHPDGVLVWNGVQVFIGNPQSTHNSSHYLTHTQTEMVIMCRNRSLTVATHCLPANLRVAGHVDQ